MPKNKYIAIFLTGLFTIILSDSALATHNRAGEIIYEQIGDLSIRATIITYTRTSSFAADRDSLTLYWGDGDSTVVRRSNGTGLELPNDVKRNEYVGEHTYPTRGTYKLSMSDPNRIAGIVNVDFPNSVNIRFYIETTLTLLEPRFQGRNNSAKLLQPPIDLACVDQVYTYNPNAYDVDGDSLTYELVTPFAERGIEVPNYELPDMISPGPDNSIHLNNKTGEFTWTSPQALGEYNITYKINEYRNGVLINSMIRDMQILVRACPDENKPPEIEAIEEFCVIAGEEVLIDIFATDPDSAEVLSMTVSGGPFELENDNAIVEIDESADNSTLAAKIIWQTTCNHVSKEPYQIVVRVNDELSKPQTNLSAIKTIRIFVTAPAPEEVSALNDNNVVDLEWNSDYSCSEGNTFQGFSVWRRIGSSEIEIDSCKGGLEGMGFERIIFLVNDIVDGKYVASDPEIDPGEIYCYRIVPEFAQLTNQGNPFNRVQGLASEEVCVRSSGEKPLITNVSVLKTDDINGSILLKWLNPTSEAIDTTILTGPYRLIIDQAPNLMGDGLTFFIDRSYSGGDFNQIDFSETEVGSLNTMAFGHSFRVSIESGETSEVFSASSDIASSVQLNSTGTDLQVNLEWNSKVPWNNYVYYIYNVANDDLILLDSTNLSNYEVKNLTNDEEYCFLVESYGKYGVDGLPSPLINLSNKSCAIPNDNVAPCSPTIEVATLCDNPSLSRELELENVINWTFSDGQCVRSSDIAAFKIFYAENVESNYTEIGEVSSDVSSYIHSLDENIAGCYAIRAIDVAGNISDLSNVICVDNCPLFELPNTFTPNGDSSNDLFIPRQNRFIDKVEFKVFNRWGEQVFETTDPKINWNGNSKQEKPLSEATYYYTCSVFEKRVSGVELSDVLRGTIQLIR